MKGISFFEKYLTLWVIICIAVGVCIDALFGEQMQVISSWEIAHVNISVAVLIWLMIYTSCFKSSNGRLKAKE